MMEEKRGSIAFFATYRPPVPLNIYSCPLEPPPTSEKDEVDMTDGGESYNYNGQVIPRPSLKKLLKRPQLTSLGIYKDADVDSGRLSGFIFVSERGEIQLEILHIALRFNDNTEPKVKVFNLADVFGTTDFNGVRMEDGGCFAGDYLVYVSTKERAKKRRQPWTAVYKTHLITGKTERLTISGEADLSPSVSPSGKMIAVASFQRKKGGCWEGEIEDLKTDIYVMNVERPLKRKLAVRNGGWPTWGSDNVIFFHRNVAPEGEKPKWGVFRADISKSIAADRTLVTTDTPRVLPDEIDAENIDARTPSAIDENKVAVATIRMKFDLEKVDEREQEQYRHIEIFEYSNSTTRVKPKKLTQKITSKADHYNPFVIDHTSGSKRIGYHRCNTDGLKRRKDISRQFHKLQSPDTDIGVFRVSGVFPTFSRDGSKLAFVDNEFRAVWVADEKGLRVVHEEKVNNVFSPVWNQNPKKDILYVCIGPSFKADQELNVCAIKNVSTGKHSHEILTSEANNAFPSTNREGTELVFRSTRYYQGKEKHKNLCIMDAETGEFGDGKELIRLTEGPYTDTHCQWSPNGDWIVFSSNRGKPEKGVPDLDNGLDSGYFSVYLVSAAKPNVMVRVVGSGDDLAGHVNHPFFSPDGKSIVVTADLAAVSADPVSLPLFQHSVRPYGDIFTINIDQSAIDNNMDVKDFERITHSRYEYSTATWTKFSTRDTKAAWNMQLSDKRGSTPTCPYLQTGGGESWHMTGHLCIPRRCC